MRLRLRDQKENIIYLILWLVLFAAPVLSSYIRSSAADTQAPFQWTEILHVWKVYAIFFMIFLLHNFVLAPLLIYQHKKGLYFATAGTLILVFVLFNCMNPPHQRYDGPREPKAPPHALHAPHAAPPPPMPPAQPPASPPMRPDGGDIVNSILLILLLGMNLGVKLYFKSERDRNRLQRLERESVESQLEYLKYQINPHFFMNTLNNIHALVDIAPEQAKETIVDLSRLMRYVLYEGAGETVPLQRDIEFIENYIKLMRLRYTDHVSIDTNLPDFTTRLPASQTLQIPPMLLITFVENAFKHGVSYQHPSFIDIQMHIAGHHLSFECRNSKQPHAPRSTETPETEASGKVSAPDQAQQKPGSAPRTASQQTPKRPGKSDSGIGLSNVRRRLELLYGSDYKLNIDEGGDTYSVSLDIPLRS